MNILNNKYKMFSNKRPEKRNGDWLCKNHPDWFLNFASNSTCKKCGSSKPGNSANTAPTPFSTPFQTPVQKGDWKCDGCHYNNFANNQFCKSCKLVKDSSHIQQRPDINPLTDTNPAPLKLRDTDWFCPKCQDIQFENRVTCRKCGASKPLKEDAEIEDGCMICFANIRNALLIHGDDSHNVTCLECAKNFKECPLCRKPIEKVVKLYK
jgi:hypothetical protein